MRGLLGDRALEHAVDLLVRRVHGRLGGLSSGQRLVGSALRAAGSLAGGLCGAVGLVGLAVSGSNIRLQFRYLRLQTIDIGLDGLEILYNLPARPRLPPQPPS